MYKLRTAYDKRGNKIYCVYRDGKLKYCGKNADQAQRVRQMFIDFYRMEGVAV